jgi:pimeloyl-ACP methyl ester carboxylesterase
MKKTFRILFVLITVLVSSPPIILAGSGYVIDPVGLATIFVENPLECNLNYLQFDDQGNSVRNAWVNRSSQGGRNVLVADQVPLLAVPREVLRGEQINLGYEPANDNLPGMGCLGVSRATVSDTVTILETPTEWQPFKHNFRWFLPEELTYHRIIFPSGVKIHIYIRAYVPQPPYVVKEIYHPIILVHGLNETPDVWLDGERRIYREQLLANGYPDDFIVSYSYADSDGNAESYDNQGDITKVAQNMDLVVNNLATKFEQRYGVGKCGQACIDVVGFSLGGVVTRQYINEHMSSHKLRRVVTIGSPHAGSFWLKAETWVESIPFGGQFIKNALIDSANLIFLLRASTNKSTPLDLRNPAPNQLIPDSDFLDVMNSFVYQAPYFNAVYGDLDLQFKQRLFHFELSSPRVSVGDGIVAAASAQAIPAVNLTKQLMTDHNQYFSSFIRILKQNNSYVYQLDFGTTDELKYFHLNLPNQQDVIDHVLSVIGPN